MKTISTLLLVFLLADVTYAQSRIQFIKKTEPLATHEHSYSARHKVKLMTSQGKWTRWQYCDSISGGNTLHCGDTAYLLDQFTMIKVNKPRTISRILPFIPIMAFPAGLIYYGRIKEELLIHLLVSISGVPLSVYGVVMICKKRPRYELKEWTMIVENETR